jgi:hypothetical protein
MNAAPSARCAKLPRRALRAGALAAALGFALLTSGCGTSSFDPTDMFDFLDTKKKLPGDRKPVFPEGVPGIERGVPPDMMKGAAAERQRQEEQAATEAAARAEEEKRRAEAKAAARKAKPKTARRPAPADDSSAPTQVTVQRPPAQQQPAQQQPSSPFPAPLPSGTFSR